MQEANSRHWFERGRSELQAGHAELAAASFRNALSFRRNREYLFLLSQALVAAGEFKEARGYLLNLWDEQPGRGEVNLALARLEARTGPAEEAVRYYQNAIYGVWDHDPDQRRREVRFELADFLLRRGDRADAESVLIPLASNLPHEFEPVLRTAQLFASAGDITRALNYYEQASRLNTSSTEAFAGAGYMAFELGNYALARRYLERASTLNPSDKTVTQKLQLARNLLKMDPLQRGLSATERHRRTVAAWKQAMSTTSACAQQKGLSLAHSSGPQSDFLSAYSDLTALEPDMCKPGVMGIDAIESTLARIDAAESATLAVCGQLRIEDQALQLIANAHGITAK